MRGVIAAIAVILATVPSQAIGANWYWVSGSSDSLYFVDISSIVEEGDYREIWVRGEYPEPIADLATRSKELFRFNCRTRTEQILVQIAYAADGREVARREFTTLSAQLEHVAPDTTDEHLLRYACADPASRRDLIAYPTSRPVEETARIAFIITRYATPQRIGILIAAMRPGLDDPLLERLIEQHIDPAHRQHVRQLVGLR